MPSANTCQKVKLKHRNNRGNKRKSTVFVSEKFLKSEKLEKRIRTTCSLNTATCEFRQGRILYMAASNISFIEPH